MDRRGFLRFLGLGAAAAVAPTKAYSFLGGILRPRPALEEAALWTPTYKVPDDFLQVYVVSSSWTNGREWGKTWFDRAGGVIRSEGGVIPDNGYLVPNADDSYELTFEKGLSQIT